jgi:hypothetical protein
MSVRPVTDAEIEELSRGLKLVVDEKRWATLQPPVTEAEPAERFRTRIVEGRRAEAAIDARPPHVHKIELEVWPDNEAAIGSRTPRFEREGLRREHYRRGDGKLHSSAIMGRLFPEAY